MNKDASCYANIPIKCELNLDNYYINYDYNKYPFLYILSHSCIYYVMN